MPFDVFERTGFATEEEAEIFAEEFRFDGWTAEVIEEDDGTFTLRLTPPAERPAASNEGVVTDVATDGAPETAATGGVKGLLDFIAQFESNGNYNAFFRNAGNQNNPKFTQMKLSSVLDWQRNHTQVNGSPSSAVGRYQIIRGTLQGLINSMGLDADTVRFTQETQDSMAIKLLEEKGLRPYLAGTTSAEDFANQVTKVWAALPIVTNSFRDNKNRLNRKGFSFYAGDGLNKAHAKVDDYLAAVTAAKT